MAIIASSVLEDGNTQANGRKYVRLSFTDHVGIIHYQQHSVAAATDAEVLRAAQITPLETTLKEQERNEAFLYGCNGGDIDVFTWQWNTTAEIQTYWWRRFMNLYRDASEDKYAGDKIPFSITGAPYYNKNTNPVIRGFLDAGWSNNNVGSALNKIAAVAVNAAQLDHGQAEIPL